MAIPRGMARVSLTTSTMDKNINLIYFKQI